MKPSLSSIERAAAPAENNYLPHVVQELLWEYAKLALEEDVPRWVWAGCLVHRGRRCNGGFRLLMRAQQARLAAGVGAAATFHEHPFSYVSKHLTFLIVGRLDAFRKDFLEQIQLRPSEFSFWVAKQVSRCVTTIAGVALSSYLIIRSTCLHLVNGGYFSAW